MLWDEVRNHLVLANEARTIKARREHLRLALEGIGACKRGRVAALRAKSLDEAWGIIGGQHLAWYVQKIARLKAGDVLSQGVARVSTVLHTIERIAWHHSTRMSAARRNARHAKMIRQCFNCYGESI